MLTYRNITCLILSALFTAVMPVYGIGSEINVPYKLSPWPANLPKADDTLVQSDFSGKLYANARALFRQAFKDHLPNQTPGKKPEGKLSGIIAGCEMGKTGACKSKTNPADYITLSMADGSLLSGTENLNKKEISDKKSNPRLRLSLATVTLKNKSHTYSAITGPSGEFLFDAVVPGLYYLTAAHPDYEDQRNLPVTVDDLGQVKTVLLGNPDERAERGNAVVEIYDQKLKFNILPYIRISDDNAITYKIHENKLHVSGLVYNKTYSIQVLGELIGGISYDTVLSLKISPEKAKKVGTSGTTTKEADLLSASGQKNFFLSGAFSKKLYLKESPVMHYPGGREMLTGNVLIVNESGNLLAEYLNRKNLSEPQLEKSLFGLAEMHKDGAGFGVYQVNICAKGANPDICDIKSGYTAFYHFEIIQGKLDASYEFLGNKKYISAKAQEGNAVSEVLRLEIYGLGVGLADKSKPTFWKAPTLSTFSERLKQKNISYKDKNLYRSFYEKKITAGSSLNESIKIEFCNSCNLKGKNLFYHYDLGLVKNNSDSVLKMNLRFRVDKQLSYSLKFECAQNDVCSFRDVQNQFLESLGYKDEVTYRRDLRANMSLIPFFGNFLEFVTCDLEKDYDCALNASGGAMVEVALLGVGKVYSVGKRLVVVGRPGQIGKNTKISPEDTRRLEELIRGAERIPCRVKSRINLANGRTRFTPLRQSGEQVNAGMEHIRTGHFHDGTKNAQSIFTLSEPEIRIILQSQKVVKAEVRAIGSGKQIQFERIVDTGEIIGKTRVADGRHPTSWVKVMTDEAGNIITAYPVPKP